MASPLIIVAELDGFQHGPEPFTPKCLAFACDRLEFSESWQFNTSGLAARPVENLSTYYHQATFVHGLPLSGPGIPLDLFPQVFLHTVDQILFELFQIRHSLPIPDSLLIFTKGAQKVDFLKQAVTTMAPAGMSVTIKNLEDLHCPPFTQLAPEMRHRPIPTSFKANEFAKRLADQGIS